MCIVSFKTLTAAQKASVILNWKGVFSQVVSVDPALTKYGCSYGVSFSSGSKETAASILRKSRMTFGEVFC